MPPVLNIIHQDQSVSQYYPPIQTKLEQIQFAEEWWNLRTPKEQAWITNYLIQEKKVFPIPRSEFILRAFQTDWDAFFEFNSLHSIEK